jgi:hypothetical protein
MDTVEKFNSLPWHDSKLIGVSLGRVQEEDQVILNLMLWNECRLSAQVMALERRQ